MSDSGHHTPVVQSALGPAKLTPRARTPEPGRGRDVGGDLTGHGGRGGCRTAWGGWRDMVMFNPHAVFCVGLSKLVCVSSEIGKLETKKV